jgi:hypothetical protein
MPSIFQGYGMKPEYHSHYTDKLWIRQLGFDSEWGIKIFQYPYHWPVGALSQGIKWLSHEADRSPSASSKVKNGGAIICTPSYIIMAWCLNN